MAGDAGKGAGGDGAGKGGAGPGGDAGKGGAPGGNGGIQPADQRKFLEGFGVEGLAEIPDADIGELYTRYNTQVEGLWKAKHGEGAWPQDWRDQLVGKDAKLVKRMERYDSPTAVANALISLQNRLSSGELRSALKEGAGEEEVKKWRAENGIPEKPEGYDISKLPNGIVFGDEDKPFIDSFLKAAHGANFHPNQVTQALAWYHGDREAQIAERAKVDGEQAQEVDDALHARWGAEFTGNRNAIFQMLDGAPEGVKDAVMRARGPDDRALFNNVDFILWLDSLRREINPNATVLPGSGGDIPKAIEAELADLTKMMGNKTSPYWKGPKAEALQARYRELIDAKEKMDARAKKAA